MSRRVSVILPTCDGIQTLPEVVARLRAQRAPVDLELIALDSGSRDGTREYLSTRVDLLIDVAPEQFDHGLTRNLGLERSRGELVVLLVQDALPADPNWLAALIAPFEDPRVAGSFARQLPRPDASAITRYALSRSPASAAAPRVTCFDPPGAFDSLSPRQKLEACAFDDVCSCIRRSVWREHPFRQADIAEDLQWAREVLRAGHAISFAPGAAVYHSHERGPAYELERTFLVHRRLGLLFGAKTVAGAPQLAWAVASQLLAHARVLAGEPRGTPGELTRALSLALVWPLGQYLGGLASTLGRSGPPMEGR